MSCHKLFSLLAIATLVLAACSSSPTEVTEPTSTPEPTIAPSSTPEPIILPSPTPEQPAGTPIPAATETIHLIYDDDGSRDGTAALLYLLSRPEISVDAVNISYGEAHPDVYIQHMGRMMDVVGFQDIPLGAGQDAPLDGGTPFPDWLRELCDNFWDYPLPNNDKTYPTQYAPELMVSTINQSSEPVTIFLSGTFTNLAQALQIDPDIRENIAAVYFMGGAVYAPGNITNLMPESNNLVAEWNIVSDPQAAKEVFEAGLNMFMIPLDATNQVKHILEEIQPWHQGDEKAKMVAELYEIMLVDYGFETVEIFDLTAAAIMVQPDLCPFQPFHLDVVTDEGSTSGQTIVVPDSEPNIHVCLEPNVAEVKQHLDDSFLGNTSSSEMPAIDPVIGIWAGTAVNNGFEMQVSITIEETCQLGRVCGRFDIPTASCSGTLTWVGMDGALYQFEAGDKTEACGEGIDYLEPQADGTVLYVSRGDYGETTGVLQREP